MLIDSSNSSKLASVCLKNAAGRLNICMKLDILLQKPPEPEEMARPEVPAEELFEQKITPAQIRAWVTSGQPLNLPGFQPQLLPIVHMGARSAFSCMFSIKMCKVSAMLVWHSRAVLCEGEATYPSSAM